jgi:hypothetical protein
LALGFEVKAEVEANTKKIYGYGTRKGSGYARRRWL